MGRLLRRIAHRGPDGEGLWNDQSRGLWLGHRRLSILDLSSAGSQPMHGPDGTVIVFNGEIYNYRELAAEWPTGTLRSGTDTEVLLRLLHRDGLRCLDRLNGMFAFAAWDPRQGRLLLARDRLGIKPLYYTTLGGRFAFASEIPPLLELPWVGRQLDRRSLYHFLTFNNVPAPDTLFEGINKLHPGEAMVVGPGGIERQFLYWNIGYSANPPADESLLADGVLGQLRRSVRAQTVSDVPVGAFLSGGVDSSAVVAVMSELTTEPVRTFSVGFEGAPSYDERNHARAIARRYRTDHRERVVTREEIVEFLPRIAGITADPLADSTCIPIYFISQMARESGTKVILTGDGADEMFAGYRGWLRYARYDPLFRRLASAPATPRRLAGWVAMRLGEGTVAQEMLLRASKRQEFFWAGAGGFKESAKRTVLSQEFLSQAQAYDLHAYLAARREEFAALVPPARSGDIVDWMVFCGLKDMVPNQYLLRADLMGMANSIELRVPYLDHEFVELATSIPGRWKVRGGEPKYILKKALEPILPRETLYRRKQGFVVPLKEWMQETMADHVEGRLGHFCRETGLFSEAGVRDLLAEGRAGVPGAAHSLWNVFFLMSWFDQWLA